MREFSPLPVRRIADREAALLPEVSGAAVKTSRSGGHGEPGIFMGLPGINVTIGGGGSVWFERSQIHHAGLGKYAGKLCLPTYYIDGVRQRLYNPGEIETSVDLSGRSSGRVNREPGHMPLDLGRDQLVLLSEIRGIEVYKSLGAALPGSRVGTVAVVCL